MPDLSKLLTLKDHMIKATDFTVPCNYFFDHFGESPQFMRSGVRAEAAFLRPIIEGIGKSMLNKTVSVTGMMITHIPEYQFYHGACFIDGKIANLFYYKDIDMGILSMLQAPGVLCARFSCVYQAPNQPKGTLH